MNKSLHSEDDLCDPNITQRSDQEEVKATLNYKNIKNESQEDTGSDTDTDQEILFLFSSSLKVGSNFIKLLIEDDDPTSDVILIGPDIESIVLEDY